MLLNLTLYNIDQDSLWNTTTVNDASQLSNVTGSATPGFATSYNLNSIDYGQNTDFQSIVGVGAGNSTDNARAALMDQSKFITNGVTNYNITDLMVLSANYNRMAEEGQSFISTAQVINIGNTNVTNADMAFVVNRTTINNEMEVYSYIFENLNLQPCQILDFNISWVPLEEGVFIAGWVVGTASNPYSDDDLLNNILARTIFIYNELYYDQIKYSKFMVFPDNLVELHSKSFTLRYSAI